MKSLRCPQCGLAVTTDLPADTLICPSCYNPFELPSGRQWPLLVVPILAILHFVHFLL